MRISDWSSDVCSSDLDVVEHREVLAEGEVLMHHADAGGDGGARRAGGQAPPEGLDAARVGDIVAEKDRHQGGLAGAVLAQQGEDLAAAQLKRDGVVGGQPAGALGDAGQRSEERSVGKECVSTGRSRWSTYH